MFIGKVPGSGIRWREGERLDHLFEARCEDLATSADHRHPAVLTAERSWSYRELDDRANQAARHLIAKGIRAGDRVGLLFDKSVETYVALLAVLKINAAYVPLDGGFPADRIAFILADAGVKTMVAHSSFRTKLAGLPQAVVYLDDDRELIDALPADRLGGGERGKASDDLAYIIYTSGTTGNPKGVAVDHASICNFVRVAVESYGIRQSDRIYQGMTIAFDFSVEEIWVPLMAGATLVPGPSGSTLVGDDLARFLEERRITALCCVPTLLATIADDLPDLRLLLVSGEACPQDLVKRWHRRGRTMLNAYGPTEATVTATLTELHPGKPVTIGFPLPTYSVVILAEDSDRLVPPGETGEIGIAGVGLARGYLNRDDLTAKKFIPDFLDLPDNPSQRIYRTGDLGRLTKQGEIEYFGRIDTQVKIRGYRIELTEIESVIMQIPGIAQAVVNTYETEPGSVELVGYYSLQKAGETVSAAHIVETLRRRLPPYMVPAFLEELPVIPMSSSHKADRKHLPPPKSPRLIAASGTRVAPSNATEKAMAEVLAAILKVDSVSVTDDFFIDLGAHSLLMARFCSQLRQQPGLSGVSMRDIYLNPSVAKLARFMLAGAQRGARAKAAPYRIPSNLEYYGCGLLQLLFYVGAGWLALELFVFGFEWLLASQSLADCYFRVLGLAVATFVGLSALPIAAKWILIGKWRTGRFPIWGLRYFRFWVVKTLIQASPILVLQKTPLYNVYLRLLGAKIGANVLLQSKVVPVCADLISIGSNTVVRGYSIMTGYKAESGYIHTGPIMIGRNAIVGEASLVDIDTVIGDDAQLGHASALTAGGRIPRGKRYHGCPAQECGTDFRTGEPRQVSRLRMTVYTAVQVFLMLVTLPVMPMMAYVLFPGLFGKDLLATAALAPAMSVKMLLLILALSVFMFVSRFISALARIAGMPRVYNLFMQEGRVYVLYGFHYYLFTLISAVSNSHFFNLLFGDSSFIVNYLHLVGVNLSKVVQTGSNFGTDQIFESPFLCTVGSGTMVSSRLIMLNGQFTSTSFKLSPVAIGENNFLGNFIFFPPEARVGANCLLASKVMVPIDGARRENVGLLGSPSFEIPRSIGRDRDVAEIYGPEAQRERLRRKDKANLKSMSIALMSQWLFSFLSMLVLYGTILAYVRFEFTALAASAVALTLFSIGYLVFFEWWSLGFRRLKADRCTILDEPYWRVEHHWKLSDNVLNTLFKGTPLRNAITRMLGSKVGRKVYDDGYATTERSLVEIGDYSTVNELAILQAHSLEDGIFKSDLIKIGKGCTIGPNSLVHYGVVMGEGAVLAPSAFLMKGEVVDPASVWQGNPARQVEHDGQIGSAPPIAEVIDMSVQSPLWPVDGEAAPRQVKPAGGARRRANASTAAVENPAAQPGAGP